MREFDPIIGRWLVADPAGQHWSPYLAFGNNPVNRVDPDGGQDGDPKCPECNNGAQMLREIEVDGDKWSDFDEWLYQVYESWKTFKYRGDGIAFFGNNDFFGRDPVFKGRKGRVSHFITDPGGMLRPLAPFTWRKGPWPMGHVRSKDAMTVLEVFETAKDGLDAIEKIKNVGDPTIEALEKAFANSVRATNEKVQSGVHGGMSKARQIQIVRDSMNAAKVSSFRIVNDRNRNNGDTVGITIFAEDRLPVYKSLKN